MSDNAGLNRSGTARRVGLSKLNKSNTKTIRSSPISMIEKTPVKDSSSDATDSHDSAHKYSGNTWKAVKRTPTKRGIGRKVGKFSPTNLLRAKNKEKTPVKNDSEAPVTLPLPIIDTKFVKCEPESPSHSPIDCQVVQEVIYVDLDTTVESNPVEETVVREIFAEKSPEKPFASPKIPEIDMNLTITSDDSQANSDETAILSDSIVANSAQAIISLDCDTDLNKSQPKIADLDVTPSSIMHQKGSSTIKSEKLRKKCRLSLTITPERHLELRKRRQALLQSTSTPKRQRIAPDEEKITVFHKIFDLTNDSDTEDVENKARNDISAPILTENEPKSAIMMEFLQKRRLLESLKAMKKANEETEKLIKQWRNGGIRALQELAVTKSPPMDIGVILDQLNIGDDMYGYQRELEQFE